MSSRDGQHIAYAAGNAFYPPPPPVHGQHAPIMHAPIAHAPMGYPVHTGPVAPTPLYAPLHAPPPHNAETKKDRFPVAPKYRDLWAAVLFLIMLAGYLVLSLGFAIPSFIKLSKTQFTSPLGSLSLFSGSSLVGHILILLAALVLGFIIGLCFLICIQRVAAPTIKATLVLTVVLNAVFAIVLLLRRAYIAGALMALFAVLYAWAAYSWRTRIPFAAVMLETVACVSQKYYGMGAVAIAGMIVQVAWTILFILSLLGIAAMFPPIKSTADCSFKRGGLMMCRQTTSRSPISIVLSIAALFMFYWGSQLVQSLVHVTVSGVFGAFYYLTGTRALPTSPTLGALRRSLTTSFGSVCFGSLIIAVIRTLRTLADTAQSSSDGIIAFLACIVSCILGCIEGMVEWFNTYAFAQVAVYGKAFIPAAKDTHRLIKSRGVDALINDNLVGNVTASVTVLGGIAGGLLVFLYVNFIATASGLPSLDSTNLIIMVLLGALAGATPVAVVGSVIDSGVVATFVCLAEDPQALARSQSALFERIRQAWPEVVYGV